MIDAMRSLRRGGRIVNVGAVADMLPMDVHTFIDRTQTPMGSCWFNTSECAGMAEMVRAGTLDMSVFRQEPYPLDRINEVLAGLARPEEHTSELQSLMRISYAVLCLNKKLMYMKVSTTQNPNTRN